MQRKLHGLSVVAFHQLYFTEKLSLREIAGLFGVSHTALYAWFRRHHSDFSEGLRNHFKRSKYHLNEDFFRTWTPEMAYVLGIFATDGNVQKYAVSLSSTDHELVVKVKNLMRSTHPIHTVPPRGYSRKTQYLLRISSKRIASELVNLGVGPRKSRTIHFPKLPAECARHFIRGCWDGDGSLQFRPRPVHLFRRKQGRSAPGLVASFVSGSRSFILGMAAHLKELGIRPQRQRGLGGTNIAVEPDSLSVYQLRRHGKVVSYDLKLHSKNALEFGKYIYEGVPESMYLTRKYEVWWKACEWVQTQGR